MSTPSLVAVHDLTPSDFDAVKSKVRILGPRPPPSLNIAPYLMRRIDLGNCEFHIIDAEFQYLFIPAVK